MVARKKTITREAILRAAYEVISKEGFSRFTARNVAQKMNSSTQPIYLEFRNIEELKEAAIQEIFENLSETILEKEQTGNRLVDVGVNFVEFAKNERSLYRALYIEEYVGMKKIQKYTYDYFLQLIATDENFKDLTPEEREYLFTRFWIVTTGLASLMISEVLTPSKERVIQIFEETLNEEQALKDYELNH